MQYLESVRNDADEEDDDFMANIERNTRRYHKIISQAVDEILPAPTDASLPSDIIDVLATQVCGALSAAGLKPQQLQFSHTLHSQCHPLSLH